jgi:hypothetical protein
MNARRPSLHTRLLRVAIFFLVNAVLLTWLFNIGHR